MGPILEEFKNKKQELVDCLHKIYSNALKIKNRVTFPKPHPIEITAQGGIGTASENRFLHSYYGVDGTGWGTPFLLCPEATNVEDETLEKLSKAEEKDLYLSGISPLGVPFNNLRENSSDTEKERKVAAGRPGSACPKGHLVSNLEFTEKPICTASRQYQKLKLEELAKQNLDEYSYQKEFEKVIAKACICNDLGESVLSKNQIPKNGKRFTAICPGPNMAYFSKIVSLREIVGHIYGRMSILNSSYRPNMFNKELRCYIDYLMNEVKKANSDLTAKQIKYFSEFLTNLLQGIEYYRELFPKMLAETKEYQRKALEELHALKQNLEDFVDANKFAFQAQPQIAAV